MMPRAVTLLFVILAFALPSHALTLSKSPAHYAQELETYYQKPRQEMLPGMLTAFDRGKILANAQKRMFIASFLATLAREKGLHLEGFRTCPLSGDGRQTLAWAAWLSGQDTLAMEMLKGSSPWLAPQMRQRPPQLEQWDPLGEKSVLDMYWAAFFATGSPIWLDSIIDCALQHAHGHKGGSRAAAALYDYAPRHQTIVQRLRDRLPSLRDEEAEVITTILTHATGNNY